MTNFQGGKLKVTSSSVYGFQITLYEILKWQNIKLIKFLKTVLVFLVMSLLFFHASNLKLTFFFLSPCGSMIHCTLLNPTPEESKDKCQQTFAVDAVDGLALGAAFCLYLRLLQSLIVVKLQQHVDQLISSLLHQRTPSVETLGLSDTQVLCAYVHFKNTLNIPFKCYHSTLQLK